MKESRDWDALGGFVLQLSRAYTLRILNMSKISTTHRSACHIPLSFQAPKKMQTFFLNSNRSKYPFRLYNRTKDGGRVAFAILNLISNLHMQCSRDRCKIIAHIFEPCQFHSESKRPAHNRNRVIDNSPVQTDGHCLQVTD